MTTTIMLDDDTRQALSTALLVWMQSISERWYAAGWYVGLERALWFTGDDEARQLRVLARACGGWWTWADADDDVSGGPTFVPLEQWEKQMGEGS